MLTSKLFHNEQELRYLADVLEKLNATPEFPSEDVRFANGCIEFFWQDVLMGEIVFDSVQQRWVYNPQLVGEGES